MRDLTKEEGERIFVDILVKRMQTFPKWRVTVIPAR